MRNGYFGQGCYSAYEENVPTNHRLFVLRDNDIYKRVCQLVVYKITSLSRLMSSSLFVVTFNIISIFYHVKCIAVIGSQLQKLVLSIRLVWLSILIATIN